MSQGGGFVDAHAGRARVIEKGGVEIAAGQAEGAARGGLVRVPDAGGDGPAVDEAHAEGALGVKGEDAIEGAEAAENVFDAGAEVLGARFVAREAGTVEQKDVVAALGEEGGGGAAGGPTPHHHDLSVHSAPRNSKERCD